jgi:hypothetical protein
LKDQKGRNLLSATCFKGNYQIIDYILGLHREHKVPARVLDVTQNDALELACIRGFNLVDEDEKVDVKRPPDFDVPEIKAYSESRRFIIIKKLLAHKDHLGQNEFKIEVTQFWSK